MQPGYSPRLHRSSWVSTPERQPGAASITLARYTHALPADIERARGKLSAYLAEQAQERSQGT
jgi:hypothetical protein